MSKYVQIRPFLSCGKKLSMIKSRKTRMEIVMDKIRVILIEDDIDVCRKFQDFVKKYSDIEIIKITNSSTEAINYINKLNPDAIILDLELSDGEGSGLDVLKAVSSGKIHRKPFILVTTSNPSQIVLENVRINGADYTCKKYQAGYSEEVALSYLSMFKAQLLAKRTYSEELLLEFENALDTSTPHIYKNKIFEEINSFGISPGVKAYAYLIDAIDFVVSDMNIDYIKLLSQKYNASEDSIKKSMERAIKETWSKDISSSARKIYTQKIQPGADGPTINEFVHYYATKVQLS